MDEVAQLDDVQVGRQSTGPGIRPEPDELGEEGGGVAPDVADHHAADRRGCRHGAGRDHSAVGRYTDSRVIRFWTEAISRTACATTLRSRGDISSSEKVSDGG